MISVVQASAWYPPMSWGGTEVYVSELVRELHGRSVASTVLAPLGSRYPDGSCHDNATVRTYAIDPAPLRLGGHDQTREGLPRFREILAEIRPDIYHQHSWTQGLGLSHLRAARDLGLRTMVTVHVPGVTCLRGTMMRYGVEVCDGRIDPFVCAACWSESRGAPKPLAFLLAALSTTFGSAAPLMPTGRLTSAISAAKLVQRVRANVDAMAESTDKIIAVCQWLYDALLQNGVPPEKLVLNRHGVDTRFATAVAEAGAHPRPSANAEPGTFRLICLGRWQYIKGIDVLVRAVKALPHDMPIRLIIHGIGNGLEERNYEATIKSIAGADRRITIAPPLSRSDLPEALLRADALAVPSRWLETGPFVVLEAKAAGVPILGSRLGGIAELVREPEDGVLIAPDDVNAWADTIASMMHAPRFRASRAAEIRTMRDVAADMHELYHQLCVAPGRPEVLACASH